MSIDSIYLAQQEILAIFIAVFQVSWWVLIPIFLLLEIKARWVGFLVVKTVSQWNWVLLEVIPPPEVLKTPKAMENVLIGLSGGWSESNKRDAWLRGKVHPMFSLEMVGNNGVLRFFVRCRKEHISFIESKFYSQYPDAEIHEVEDYVESLPEYAPNAEWDMWGAVYGSVKKEAPGKLPPWTIPFRTYEDFEGDDDDKTISPLSQLGELVAQLGPNEYLLFQIIISPRVVEVAPEFTKVINHLIDKKEDSSPSFFASLRDGMVNGTVEFGSNAVNLLMGEEMKWKEAEEPEKSTPKSQFELTVEEQEIIKAVQRKASQVNFESTIHGIYLFKRDEENSARISDLNGFIRQFSNETLNGLRPMSGTYTTSNMTFFNEKRNLQRMRKLFYAYKSRWGGFMIPQTVLCTEEIASLFHLPGQIVQTPSLGRIESKTVKPPRELFQQ